MYYGLGLCNKHYIRLRKHGNPMYNRTPKKGYIKNGIGYIPLSQGMVAKVDPEDMLWLSDFFWVLVKGRGGFRACRASRKNGKKTLIQMSRMIMPPSKKRIIDHINHDTLDNRKSNLRVCTFSQNCWNRKGIGGFSRFKGVCRSRKQWAAYITFSGARKYLGTFSKETEAAMSYNNAAKKYFGSYALLNRVP